METLIQSIQPPGAIAPCVWNWNGSRCHWNHIEAGIQWRLHGFKKNLSKLYCQRQIILSVPSPWGTIVSSDVTNIFRDSAWFRALSQQPYLGARLIQTAGDDSAGKNANHSRSSETSLWALVPHLLQLSLFTTNETGLLNSPCFIRFNRINTDLLICPFQQSKINLIMGV